MKKKPVKVTWTHLIIAFVLLTMLTLFTAKPVEAGWPGQTFTLTVDVSPGGIVTVNQATPSSYPVEYTFENGEHVTLEAVPDHGYRFSNWSGDLTGTANPSIIEISCNLNVTADFVPNNPLLVELLIITAVIGLLIVASIIVRYRWQ